MAEAFRRPLGVFLQGGGALGAWQAGALEVLDAAGLRFDSVMGYSIGAVNGASLAFGRLPEALARWRRLDGRALRLRPQLNPFALFSPEPLRTFFAAELDDEAAKANLKAELTIVVAAPDAGAAFNARFTPGARGGWDAPLVEFAAASCAIPYVFPSVTVDYRGRRLRLIDGGVPMGEGIDLSPLAGCADLLMLEMVRPDEKGRRAMAPWKVLDQAAREKGLQLVDDGLARLLNRREPPRVFRLGPSRRLEPAMLDFRAAGLARLLERGAGDARAFLDDPARFQVP